MADAKPGVLVHHTLDETYLRDLLLEHQWGRRSQGPRRTESDQCRRPM